MNYSDNDNMVRVDFFKSSGKWYTTEAVEWLDYSKKVLIHDAFKNALRNHFNDNPYRLSDMDAICLEPFHEHAHPVQLKNGSWIK